MSYIVHEYITKINEELSKLEEKHKICKADDLLIAFRGEPRDFHETSLMPSIFRNDGVVQKEKYLFELENDFNLVSSSATNIEKAIESQHYIAISRMLDITFNCLIGLYFACSNSEYENDDGVFYIFSFPKYYSPHSNYIEKFYTDMLDEKYLPYSQNFKVFSHTYSNERIRAQSGGFIFFPGTQFKCIDSCYYEKINIKSSDKKKILHELDKLFAINQAKLFPEKDNIAEVVKSNLFNNDYVENQVTIENEIDLYFKRINYELKMSAHERCLNEKDIMRFLRKEENDLKLYINYALKKLSDENDDESEKLHKKVKDEFDLVRLEYRGTGYNG